MNESMDRVLRDWLDQGPDRGPGDGLDRALAATRLVGQRPGWTLSERWLPMQLTMARTSSQRPILIIATLALLMFALVASALLIGSRRPSLPSYLNGAVVFEKDGDLFIADQLGAASRALTSGPEYDLGPVFSPQGDRIAFIRDGWVMTVRTDGTDARELAPGGADLLDWAPDGSAILSSVNGLWPPAGKEVFVIETDGSGSRSIETGSDGAAGLAAWRPGGRHIALAGQQLNRAVAVIADADGADVGVIWSSGSHLAGLAWSPDGMRLALSDPLGNVITVVDVDAAGDVTTSHELVIDSLATHLPNPSWSPDGRRLAVLLTDGRVGISAVDGSEYRIVGPTNEPSNSNPRFIWAPDGRSLVIAGSAYRHDPATGTWDWTDTSWWVDAATGEVSEVGTPVESWQRIPN